MLQRIASSFTTHNGEYTITKVRLHDDEVPVPDSAALMQNRPADPQKKAEQLAETLRRSKRRELQSRTLA